MATTLTRVLVHITFSTKGRAAIIAESVAPDLHAYLGGICRGLRSPAIAIGGVADHVHLAVSVAKSVSIAELMLNVKRDSSRWMRRRMPGFAWPEGYFAFSIGASGVDALVKYIANQRAHHARMDFKDEVRALFRKYGVEFDERYVWE